MMHTPDEITNAMSKRQRLVAFLDAAHRNTSDLTVAAPTGRNNRVAEHSVPRELGQPIVQHATDELRALEKDFGMTPWVAPKGVPGKAEKKEGSGQ